MPRENRDADATISAQTLLFHIERYRRLGGELPEDNNLKALGLNIETLEISEQRFPVAIIGHAANVAADNLRDPALGLRHVAEFDASHSKFILVLKSHANTLSGFVALVSRYLCIYTEIAVLVVQHEVDGKSAIILKSHVREVLSYHQVDAALYLLANAIRAFNGLSPLYVQIDHDNPGEKQETMSTGENDITEFYEDSFGAPVVFGCKRTALCFLTSDVIQVADVSGQGIFPRILEHKRGRLVEETVKEKVCFVIRRMLIRGEPCREQVAISLCVSVRTLQRSLSQEGVSYQGLLEAARKQLVLEYLDRSNYTTAQLALLLGYSEASQFYKAFRRWFNMSPRALKAQRLHL